MAVSRTLRRVLWAIGGFVVLVVAAVAGCMLCHPDATTRLARHFDLVDVSSEKAIEAGLLEKIPVGTSEHDIEAFLDKSGIGKDGLSSWDPANKAGVIFCDIKFDRTTFEFVKDSYGIFFQLDERRTLASIRVSRVYTGL